MLASLSLDRTFVQIRPEAFSLISIFVGPEISPNAGFVFAFRMFNEIITHFIENRNVCKNKHEKYWTRTATYCRKISIKNDTHCFL